MVRGGVITTRAGGWVHRWVNGCPTLTSHSFARRMSARNTPWMTSSSDGMRSGYRGFSALRNGRPFLKAENPRYPDLIPSEELVIQGVFRALIRRAKE